MAVTVTLAQINPTTADIEGNTERILAAYEAAARAHTDVVVFPEMAITGYCILDLVEDGAFLDANRAALDRVRGRTGETAAVVGFVDRDERGRYNATAVLQGGELKGVSRKVLLPNYRYFDDERYFEAGREVAPVGIDVDGEVIELGVTVCEDMWDADYDRKPVRELADAGADLLVNVNASPFEVGKRRTRHGIIQRHVEATGLPFLYLNTAGVGDVGKNIIVFDGDSLAYDGHGELLARGDQFGTDWVTVAVEPGQADGFEGGAVETVDPAKERYEALVFALRDYAAKTGFTRAIEPISGGIDSSLGLAVCAEALGPENVVAYSFPSDVNTERTKRNARALAENLGVEFRVVPVEPLYGAVIDTYEEHVGPIRTRTARENVYARLRGLLAMLASNDSRADEPAMLVSNGNETEMALGYVTLYGDMAGGVDLLGDVSKPDVYAVARHVNDRHGEAVIPEDVFEIEPSAELSPGQVDPFDYPVVSPIVDDLLEVRWSPAEIVARFERRELDPDRFGRDDEGRSIYERYDVDAFEEVVYDTYGRLRRSAFKRVQAPPVIAVSKRAFGTDFREPIINAWDGRPIDWAE